VLDLGCGGGQNTIALAKMGAVAIGVDFAPEQLIIARNNAVKNEVEAQFLEGNLNDSTTWPVGPFDIVLSVFAIEYVRDLLGLCRGVASRMTLGGRFVLCDLHPFVAAGDVIGPELSNFWHRYDYFDRREIPFAWNVAPGAIKMYRYHRTLEDYVRSLISAGFIIDDLREPIATWRSLDVPYADTAIVSNEQFWSRMPYSIILRGRLEVVR
jgi:SAM-dependent methyltransferase